MFTITDVNPKLSLKKRTNKYALVYRLKLYKV